MSPSEAIRLILLLQSIAHISLFISSELAPPSCVPFAGELQLSEPLCITANAPFSLFFAPRFVCLCTLRNLQRTRLSIPIVFANHFVVRIFFWQSESSPYRPASIKCEYPPGGLFPPKASPACPGPWTRWRAAVWSDQN